MKDIDVENFVRNIYNENFKWLNGKYLTRIFTISYYPIELLLLLIGRTFRGIKLIRWTIKNVDYFFLKWLTIQKFWLLEKKILFVFLNSFESLLSISSSGDQLEAGSRPANLCTAHCTLCTVWLYTLYKSTGSRGRIFFTDFLVT